MPNREERLQQILDLTTYRNSNQYVQGKFYVTGQQQGSPDPERRIGFLIQVRKGCGQFGSDMLLLRHPNGKLCSHENQSIFPMTDEQEQLARPMFEWQPETEDMNEPYAIDGVWETGFIIEHPSQKSTFPDHCAMAITIKG